MDLKIKFSVPQEPLPEKPEKKELKIKFLTPEEPLPEALPLPGAEELPAEEKLPIAEELPAEEIAPPEEEYPIEEEILMEEYPVQEEFPIEEELPAEEALSFEEEFPEAEVLPEKQALRKEKAPGRKKTHREEKKPKKQNNKVLWILLCVCTALLAIGGILLLVLSRPTPIRSITFAATDLVLKEGQSALPSFTISPADAGEENLQWKTTNRSVATVSNGMIVAHKEGSCMISVTSESGAKDTLNVKVEAPLTPEEEPVVGAWRLFAVAEGEQLRYYYSIEASLFIYENHTGYFTFDGVEYDVKDWRYDGKESTYSLFRCQGDGLERGFYYCRDGSSPYDRCLIIPLEGKTLIFHRENE